MPLWDTPPGPDLQFFSFLEVHSPLPGTQKETIPRPQAPDRPHLRFLVHLFDPYKSKTTRFHNFYREDITRWREYMNFIFELQNNILRKSAAGE